MEESIIILHIVLYFIFVLTNIFVSVVLKGRKNSSVSEAFVAFLLLVLGFSFRILEYGVKLHDSIYGNNLPWLEQVFVILADSSFMSAAAWVVLFWLKILVTFLGGNNEFKIDTIGGEAVIRWRKLTIIIIFVCNIVFVIVTVVFRKDPAMFNSIQFSYHIFVASVGVIMAVFGALVTMTVRRRLQTGKYQISHAKNLAYCMAASFVYVLGFTTVEAVMLFGLRTGNTLCVQVIGSYVALVGDVFFELVFLFVLAVKPCRSFLRRFITKYILRPKLAPSPSVENVFLGTSSVTRNTFVL